MKLIKIFSKYNFLEILFLILKKLKLIKYTSSVERKKMYLEKKIINITKKIVSHGIYKGIKLNCKSSWGTGDYSSKLLGFYELQIQKKIIELKKKYNLKYLINFGAAEGYHLIGLIKNCHFLSGIAYEASSQERINLNENLYLNDIREKVKILEKANFQYIHDHFDKKQLDKTLYLCDIEGAEFDLFNLKNLSQFKRSILLIENHDFFIKDKIKVDIFFNLIKENFKLEILSNGARNPNIIPELDKFKDDDKWLLVSEGRICNQEWLVCIPNNYNN